MNQSEQINELVSALCKAQAKMKPAIFNKVNPHFKSRYADFTSCMDACREPLAENNLCIMQYVEMISEKITLVTMLAHSSGQWIKSFFPLIPTKNDSQGLGSAMTYAKRYGLSSLLGIVSDDEDDDANAACAPQRGQTRLPETITLQQFQVLSKTLEVVPTYKAQVNAWLVKQGITDLMGLHANMFEGVLKAAEKAIELQQETLKTA